MKFKKQKDHWNELLLYEKRFEVAMWVLFCAFFGAFILDMLDVFDVVTMEFPAFEIAGVLITAAEACAAVAYWRTNRQVARSFLTMAIIFGLGAIRNIVKLFI